jgi:hypothetical protein
MKAIHAVLAVVLCSCTAGPLAHSQQSPATTAESIAFREGDIPGLKRCPQTGSWDSYLAWEKSNDPKSYAGDAAANDSLKVFGLTESYISVYSDNPSECAFFSHSGVPKGRFVYVFADKFQTAGYAQALYGVNVRDYKVGGVFLDQVVGKGGTLIEGSPTGLGEVSLIATLAVDGVSNYTAYWSDKAFDVIVGGENISASEGTNAAKRINARIH